MIWRSACLFLNLSDAQSQINQDFKSQALMALICSKKDSKIRIFIYEIFVIMHYLKFFFKNNTF